VNGCSLKNQGASNASARPFEQQLWRFHVCSLPPQKSSFERFRAKKKKNLLNGRTQKPVFVDFGLRRVSLSGRLVQFSSCVSFIPTGRARRGHGAIALVRRGSRQTPHEELTQQLELAPDEVLRGVNGKKRPSDIYV
jgi:hypothetical protein